MSEKLVADNSKDVNFDVEDAEPRRGRVTTQDPSLKAAWYDYLYIGTSAGFYIADVVTDLLVSVKYFNNRDYIWFFLTLLCVFGASLVMMMFSLKWFNEDTAKEASKTKTVVLHVLQLGPLQRYWECYKNGKRSRKKVDADCYSIYIEQWRDIAMLRLFEVFIESAPQLVLQLYILAYNRHFDKEKDWLTACSACFSLISLSTSIVSYSKALRDAREDKGKMTWWAFGFQIIWRLAMVASRIVTLVLFASVYKSWILLVIGSHWIAMTVWIRCQKPTFSSDNRVLKFMFPVVTGFIYVFCFFNVKAGFTRKRLIFFYVLTLLENIALMGAWYPYRHEYGVVFVAALVMVVGGYFVGIVALVLYYQCYHPSLEKQGICIRTSHDVPAREGIIDRVVCCCLVRTYEDEQSSPPSGSQLHIDIPASRLSLRRDVAMRQRSTSSSPPFESEIFMHKPSQLQKQYSLEKERMKREKAERRRHSMESAVGKNKSVHVRGDDNVHVGRRMASQPRSLPDDFGILNKDEVPLGNVEHSNENGITIPVDVHNSTNAGVSNGGVVQPNGLSRNLDLNQEEEITNRNGIVHSVNIHNPRITRSDLHGRDTTVDIDPEINFHFNRNTSPTFQSGGQDGGVHRVTDEKETRTSCDDGVHCGTDDEKDTRTSCGDGVHCGTDDEKDTRTSCDDGVHCGTDDEKDTRTSCDDGVHCGTDDEKDAKTCDDGVHCGTDEKDVKTAKTNKLTKSDEDKSEPDSCKTDLSTQFYSRDDDTNDTRTLLGIYGKNTQNVGTGVSKSRQGLSSVNFRHRYSIVSDCISLSSSTSSENEDNEAFVEKASSKNSLTHGSSTVAEETLDSNSNLVDEQCSLDVSEYTPNTGSLPRSYDAKQRTINRRSNRVSFPNFVATNLRRGRFSSLRKSDEDCTMSVEDTRRHTVDFSVLMSRKPYDEVTFARLSKTLNPKKFGSVRDELEKLSLD